MGHSLHAICQTLLPSLAAPGGFSCLQYSCPSVFSHAGIILYSDSTWRSWLTQIAIFPIPVPHALNCSCDLALLKSRRLRIRQGQRWREGSPVCCTELWCILKEQIADILMDFWWIPFLPTQKGIQGTEALLPWKLAFPSPWSSGFEVEEHTKVLRRGSRVLGGGSFACFHCFPKQALEKQEGPLCLGKPKHLEESGANSSKGIFEEAKTVCVGGHSYFSLRAVDTNRKELVYIWEVKKIPLHVWYKVLSWFPTIGLPTSR